MQAHFYVVLWLFKDALKYDITEGKRKEKYLHVLYINIKDI